MKGVLTLLKLYKIIHITRLSENRIKIRHISENHQILVWNLSNFFTNPFSVRTKDFFTVENSFMVEEYECLGI